MTTAQFGDNDGVNDNRELGLRSWWSQQWPAIVAPMLAAAYLPLAVAASLPDELLRLNHLVLPLAVSYAVCGFCWALGYRLGRSADKGALVGIIGVVAFSSVGWIVTQLATSRADRAVGGRVGVIALWGLAALALDLAVVRSSVDLARLVRFLAVTYVFLVTYVGGKTAWSLLLPARDQPPAVSLDIRAPATPAEPPRDVYLIVLDKYTSSAVLAAHYGFDNSAFESELDARGFLIPGASRPNYVHTFLALGSMLNLRYLDELPQRFGRSNRRWDIAYPLVENNRLAAFLQSRGYRFVFVPTAFGATRRNRHADLQVPRAADVRPEVHAVWAHLTAAPLFRSLGCRVLGCNVDPLPYLPSSAKVIDSVFHELGHLPKSRHPTFVLAHFLVPHEPYLYRADCTHRPPYWPMHDDGPGADHVRAAYLDQVRCVNRRIIQLVDAIRAQSRIPPIVLILGDHGHGRLGRDLPDLQQVSPPAMLERISAFAAYSLPGVPADSVPNDISPVNVLRFVLRYYFEADLPPLSEATYWSGAIHPYDFVRVR